jgi:alcohol dehydrogenase
MLSLFFENSLKLKDIPRPEPLPGEVLIRVRLAGICRTDLEVTRGYHGFRGVLGHEFVGEVAGPEDSFLKGRRVVGEINVGCGRCDWCRRGVPGHCPERQALGLKGRNGVMAPYFTLPAANLHLVPDEVPDEVAVFTEPLAAALAVGDSAPPGPGARVLVIGDGPLGLMISWTLALSGAAVHLAGHYMEHLALAKPYGVITYLEKELPGGSYDAVVEASGSPSGLDLALALVRPRGTVILKSTYAAPYLLAPGSLVVPEVTVVGSRCGPFAAALALLKSGRLEPRPLIARRLPLDRGQEAFELAARPGTLKVLLDLGTPA